MGDVTNGSARRVKIVRPTFLRAQVLTSIKYV